MDDLWEAVDGVLNWIRPFSTVISVIGLCVLTCLVYDYLASKLRSRVKMKMSPRDRRRLVKELMTEKFCDVLEDLYYSDKITRDERDLWYVLLGSRLDLPDLLPKYKMNHPHPEDLKQAIKERVGSLPTIERLRLILNRAS